ncbi:kinesin-domain-containing protein [Rozella allomycis CSF55]|uniref:Kinesin-like protein n=1 Tax=Rozella allomycis (strain CSF55) TaxID=988480 RepID=A0A075B4J0_ROZAC|nr:Kinesin, motor region domain-containing protein [Rozella allomycis CSF55]RKP20156.1 kinesin-domain-containing protein [Rozella allomycis CSF55]|eukprot:EPZ36202.1 Kinesin, motor region domain-containing protein [Rozella allomycis CSF55]
MATARNKTLKPPQELDLEIPVCLTKFHDIDDTKPVFPASKGKGVVTNQRQQENIDSNIKRKMPMGANSHKRPRLDIPPPVPVKKAMVSKPATRVAKPAPVSRSRVTVPKTASGRPMSTLELQNQMLAMGERTSALESQNLMAQETIQSISDKLKESESRVNEIKATLESKVQIKEMESVEKQKEIYELKAKMHQRELEMDMKLRSLNESHEMNARSLKDDISRLNEKVTHLKRDCEFKEEKIFQLNVISLVKSQSLAMSTASVDNQTLKVRLESMENAHKVLIKENEELKRKLEEANETIKALENQIQVDEKIRRKLHNDILELKGNIRVFCRVRPILPGESENSEETKIQFPESKEENQIEILQTTEHFSDNSKQIVKSLPFQYDRVFQPNSSQSQVFNEISQLVQSSLDGYRVCVFAYGQTNSGKSYTMEGPAIFDEDTAGMIPRAVKQIYETAEELKEKGWEYEMEATYVEIYNENIRDLLGNGEEKKHDIRHSNGKTIITDITTIQVKDAKQVLSLIEKARKNRAVGETQCNERSSRSHSVFILKLNGKNSITNEETEGVLNLIDLAGSERLSASGATGDRLKETQAINKSLSSLGDVIAALANKEQHVPYRNSKLTYLLQNSLGGNSKTLMFVNISPLAQNIQETICSLRFATKVNACQIGTARKNITLK